ncbi:MAG: PEPxxWA-CTERM sorting domain-containing protein [Phenylobacterium sp.]
MTRFAFRTVAFGAAAVAVALCASAAQATTVHDGQGILPTFDPKGAKTTDNFRDLDVKSATVSYDDKHIFFSATMFGDIGSTDTGFYVWGVDTGSGVPFFKTLHDQDPLNQPDIGDAAKVTFDTFIVLNTNNTGSVNYLSGDPSDGVESVTHDGATIRAVISRDLLEDDATLDISKWGFNIWPRANGFGNADITDFAPNDHNFNASASVPEPATWALMIAGFGLAGATLRSRRRTPQAA